jgi:hypothetical protein
MFALLFMQGIANSLADASQHHSDELLSAWYSVGQSMYTLFASATGGDDWTKFAEPLYEVGGPYFFAFLLYIIVFLFVLANIITSLFVDNALRSANNDEALLIEEHNQDKKQLVALIQPWFNSMNKDADDRVSVEEFKRHCQDKKLKAFAACLDVGTPDLVHLFKALSDDGKRNIDLETFVLGCAKLRGVARSADLMHVLIAQETLRADREIFDRNCERQLSGMQQRLDHHGRASKDLTETLGQLQPQIAAHTEIVKEHHSQIVAHTEIVKEHHSVVHHTRQLVSDFVCRLGEHAGSAATSAKSFGKHDRPSPPDVPKSL